MNKKVIIEKKNLIAYDYLVDNFAASGIKFKTRLSTAFITLLVDLDSNSLDSFYTYLAKAIVLSHKYPVIMAAFE